MKLPIMMFGGLTAITACAACGSSDEEPSPEVRPDDSAARNNTLGRGADAGGGSKPLQPDKATSSSSSSPDASSDPSTACSAPGAAVYAFVNATLAWRYATEPTAPEDFDPAGIAFRLAPDGATTPHATLYLLENESNGDFLVSTVPSEGADSGYGALTALGTVYLTAVAGSVPLTRYLKEWPELRHRVSIDAEETSDWEAEPPRGYVCPR
jgi:hypothetical protein